MKRFFLKCFKFKKIKNRNSKKSNKSSVRNSILKLTNKYIFDLKKRTNKSLAYIYQFLPNFYF